jgi:succinate dehydrogenase / fumarate reductase membrane anchor subunit
MLRDQTLWTWHLIAGFVILVLLGLHMGIMHLDAALGIFNPAGDHPIDWENVAARSQSLGFAISYILLLGAALFHGFYGLRNIAFETGLGGGARRTVSWALLTLGIALFILGTWAAWTSYQIASSA